MSYTKRLNAVEKGAFRNWVLDYTEPALGTLAERLDILVRRTGGTTSAPRLSKRARAEFQEFLVPQDLAVAA